MDFKVIAKWTWRIVIGILLIGAAIAFLGQLGHAESLKAMNKHGVVGQHVTVSGYVRHYEMLGGGRSRMELCDAPSSLPVKHRYCVFVTFDIPATAWLMPQPGQHATCRGVITKKE